MNVYLALLHYPVYNKNQEVVATCITGMDLHDIARSATTFGVKRYFVVNPIESQLEFAGRIIKNWAEEESYIHNWTRAKALARVILKKELAEVMDAIVVDEGEKPVLVATSASAKGKISFSGLKDKFLSEKSRPVLLLFGTGWGMTAEVLEQCDFILDPIAGRDKEGYNHLSVRSAVAIVLDRLLTKGGLQDGF